MDLFLNIRHENKWGWFHNLIWWYFHRGIERHRRSKYLRRYSKFYSPVGARVHRDGFVVGKRISYAGDYACVYAYGNKFYVHLLVALCFGRNPDKKRVVNHNNGRKYDNRWLNLEGATHKENTQHAYRTGLAKIKLTYAEAQEIKRSDKDNKYLSEYYGVTASHIRSIKNGYCWNY